MTFTGITDRYTHASARFESLLPAVRDWTAPTPCTEWDVRALVNHMARGNLSYARLAEGGTAAEFLRLRDVDALGADPVGAFADSVRACADAFTRPGALARVLDYPLGRIPGEQALAVRTADSVIHTWDLARAIGADDTLDGDLVAWVDGRLDEIYAGLAEGPTAPTSRFFARPAGEPGPSRQDRLLFRMGRRTAASSGPTTGGRAR
jgi:uncharacterized protein (TIGR03086 family)